jgi:hypothetical protein
MLASAALRRCPTISRYGRRLPVASRRSAYWSRPRYSGGAGVAGEGAGHSGESRAHKVKPLRAGSGDVHKLLEHSRVCGRAFVP